MLKDIPKTYGAYVMDSDRNVISVRYNRIMKPNNKGTISTRVSGKMVYLNVNHTYGKLFVENPDPENLTEFNGAEWVRGHAGTGRPIGCNKKKHEPIKTDGWRKLLYK